MLERNLYCFGENTIFVRRNRMWMCMGWITLYRKRYNQPGAPVSLAVLLLLFVLSGYDMKPPVIDVSFDVLGC